MKNLLKENILNNMVYTIEVTCDDEFPYVNTDTIFATDSLEKAIKQFNEYKILCKGSKTNDEYILYQWDEKTHKIIDQCNNYDK